MAVAASSVLGRPEERDVLDVQFLLEQGKKLTLERHSARCHRMEGAEGLPNTNLHVLPGSPSEGNQGPYGLHSLLEIRVDRSGIGHREIRKVHAFACEGAMNPVGGEGSKGSHDSR